MPGELVVDVYNPEDRYTNTPYRQSFGTSVGMATKNFLLDISPFHRGGMSVKPVQEYTDVFKYSEGLKRDEVAYVNPIFGTQQTDPLTGKIVTGEVTYGDIQRGVEERRGVELSSAESSANVKADVITSTLQKKVDTGELTVVQAQAQADKEFQILNKDYTKAQEDIYKKEKDVKGVFERTGKARRIANLAPDLLVVGAAAGVGVFNPVAGASIATGYFAGKGIVEGTYSPTVKEIGQQGGLYAGVGTDEKGRLSILEPTELDVKFKGYRQQAGVDLLLGAAGGVSMAGAINKGYMAQELIELGESPVRLVSVSKVKGDVSYDVIKGVQTKGDLTRQFTITGKVIKQGDKSFIMPSGAGYSTTTGRVGIIPTNYAGGDIFAVGTKGYSLAVKDGYATLGKGVIEPRISFGGTFETAKEFVNIGKSVKVGGTSEVGYFAGASKKLGTDVSGAEYYKSVSGGVNVESGVVGKFKPFKILTDGRNIDVLGSPGVKAFKLGKELDVNTFGINKIIRLGEGSIDDIYRAGGGSTITGQTGGYGGGAVPASLIEQFSKSSLGTQAKIITKPTLTSGAFGLPSIFTGTGQYERTGGNMIFGGGTNVVTTPNILGFNKPSQTLIPKVEEVKPQFGLGNMLGAYGKQRGSTKQITSQLPRSNLLPRSMIGQKIRERTIQKQILEQPLIQTPAPFGLLQTGGYGGGFDFGFPYIPKGELGGGPKKRKGQRGKQKTGYQTSLTGSILGIRGRGLLPGALSVRGILEPTNKKKNKIL